MSPGTAEARAAIGALYADYAAGEGLRGICRARSRPGLRHAPRTILGRGPIPPRAIVLGEAPGATEELQGAPFLGVCGQWMGKHMKAAGVEEKDLYFTNVVKLRPPRNRAPETEEIAASMPYLQRELKIVGQDMSRSILVAMGRTAASAMRGEPAPIGTYAGKVLKIMLPDGQVWTILFTYHPSFAMRDSAGKEQFDADMEHLAAILGASG